MTVGWGGGELGRSRGKLRRARCCELGQKGEEGLKVPREWVGGTAVYIRLESGGTGATGNSTEILDND